jgi:cell division protein ZapA
MGQVTVSVNGRSYAVGCDDGEEEHVEYLAEFIDKRVRELTEAVGHVGEDRLLLMAALLIAEDLESAYGEIEVLRRGGASAAGKALPEQSGGEQLGQASLGLDPPSSSASVEALAKRLEGIAARLESA